MSARTTSTPRHGAFGLALGCCVLLALIAMSSLVLAQRPDAPSAPVPGIAHDKPLPPNGDALVERGRYLARLGDCISCHTGPSGIPFAGGLPIKTPFGVIISTNITPDRDAGIGAYTEADFARALRQGKARDGRRLYPAMPYASFARTTDEDVHTLYAYFQQGVQPSANRSPATALSWPYNMRSLMVFWNWLNLDGQVYRDDGSRSPEWNRGAYLVTGLGHCGECHTPRGRLGELDAIDDHGGARFLSGALVDNWFAQSLRHGNLPSAAQWSAQDLADYLRVGRTAHTAAFGPMVQVVENSTQYLSEQDLKAIAAYLQSVGAPANYAPPSVSPPTQSADAAPAQPVSRQLRDGQVANLPGAMIYLNNCNACHRSSGAGWDKTFPALAGNPVVNARNPDSLIRIVLTGSTRPITAGSPAPLTMPGLGWRLSDEDVAQVLSFVRGSWGNHAPEITVAQVQAVRKALPATADEAP